MSEYSEAVLDWGLNQGPPVLEANTIPLGYRGGGKFTLKQSYQYNENVISRGVTKVETIDLSRLLQAL